MKNIIEPTATTQDYLNWLNYLIMSTQDNQVLVDNGAIISLAHHIEEIAAVTQAMRYWMEVTSDIYFGETVSTRGEYLITDPSGRRLDYQQIYRQWVAACVRARVRDAHLHDIRAKSVTDADAQGLDPTAPAGHTNTAQTRRCLRGRTTMHARGPK